MDKNVKKNYIYNTLYQILILIVPLVTSPYVSRCLGPQNIGIYSYTSTVVSYFTLFAAFSFQTYGLRQVAKVQNSVNERSQLFFEIQVKKLLFCLIALIVYFIFFLFQHEYFAVYLVQSLTIISTFFDIGYFFQGLEEYKVTVIRNAIVKILGALFIFLFIKDKNDLVLYVVIQTVIAFFGNLSLWIGLKERVNPIYFHRFSLGKDTRQLLELFIPVISVQMYFSVDKIMLGMLDSTKIENGYYEQALKIIRICQTIITSLGSVLIPSVSRMIATKDKKKITDTIYSSIRLGLLIGTPMCFGIISVSNVFIPWFYGPGYGRAAFIMACLAPILVLSAISNILSNGILIPTNRHNYVSISTISAAGLNILLNLLLIPRYSGVGAAIASVASELLVLILNAFFAKEFFQPKAIGKYLIEYLSVGLIMFAILVGTKKIIAVYNLTFQVILLVGLGIILYFTLLVLLRDEICTGMINKIRKKKV